MKTETTVTKTIRDFNSVMAIIMSKVALSGEWFINDKLTYAVKKLHKSFLLAVQPHIDQKNEAVRDYNVKLCMVDERGAMVITGSGDSARYSFRPEDQAKVDAFERAQQKQLMDTLVTVTPHLIDEVPEAIERAKKLFDDFDLEELQGVLFEKLPEDTKAE